MKPANILVNEDCSVKLCDYGLARSITGLDTAEMIIKNAEPDENVEMANDTPMITPHLSIGQPAKQE